MQTSVQLHNVAYIVIPKGTEPNTVISVQVANPDGATIGQLSAADFAGFPIGGGGLAPVVNNLLIDNPAATGLNATVGGTVTATNSPTSWGPALNSLVLTSFTPGFGALPGVPGLLLQPSWNPATQAFSWDTSGSSRGTYVWGVSATNAYWHWPGHDHGHATSRSRAGQLGALRLGRCGLGRFRSPQLTC